MLESRFAKAKLEMENVCTLTRLSTAKKREDPTLKLEKEARMKNSFTVIFQFLIELPWES